MAVVQAENTALRKELSRSQDKVRALAVNKAVTTTLPPLGNAPTGDGSAHPKRRSIARPKRNPAGRARAASADRGTRRRRAHSNDGHRTAR